MKIKPLDFTAPTNIEIGMELVVSHSGSLNYHFTTKVIRLTSKQIITHYEFNGTDIEYRFWRKNGKLVGSSTNLWHFTEIVGIKL